MTSQGYFLCQVCRRDVLQVTIDEAARLAGVNSVTVNMWASSGRIHVNLASGGRLRICRESLSNSGHSAAGRIPKARVSLRVRLAVRIIEDQSSCADITLMKIAQQLNVSIWHLARLFKKNVGMSFREYLRTTRLKKAEELLRSSGLSIKEVAAAVGYKHVSDFDHHFKSGYGMTPGEYRHLHLERGGIDAEQLLPTNSKSSQL